MPDDTDWYRHAIPPRSLSGGIKRRSINSNIFFFSSSLLRWWEKEKKKRWRGGRVLQLFVDCCLSRQLDGKWRSAICKIAFCRSLRQRLTRASPAFPRSELGQFSANPQNQSEKIPQSRERITRIQWLRFFFLLNTINELTPPCLSTYFPLSPILVISFLLPIVGTIESTGNRFHGVYTLWKIPRYYIEFRLDHREGQKTGGVLRDKSKKNCAALSWILGYTARNR